MNPPSGHLSFRGLTLAWRRRVLPLHGLAQVADETLTLTKRSNACHNLSEPSLGPPWQAIAARHAAAWILDLSTAGN